MAKLSFRIDFGAAGAVGPGKIRLLERVRETGSIAAAGRSMDMSYRRAWLLIDALNRMFQMPVVATKLGGKAGGGAELTPFGAELVGHYRSMEAEAQTAVHPHLAALDAALAPAAPETEPPARPDP